MALRAQRLDPFLGEQAERPLRPAVILRITLPVPGDPFSADHRLVHGQLRDTTIRKADLDNTPVLYHLAAAPSVGYETA
jgi:hypothetical protein